MSDIYPSLYEDTQWPAVITCLSVINDPPHWKLLFQ